MGSNATRPAFGEVLRLRINAGAAIELLNDVVKGKVTDCSMVRFSAARVLIDKTCPSLSAVAIAIESKRGNSKEDIDALLLQAGLNPELEFADQLPKLSIIEHDDSESSP